MSALFSRAFIPPWSLALFSKAGLLSDQPSRAEHLRVTGTLAILSRTIRVCLIDQSRLALPTQHI